VIHTIELVYVLGIARRNHRPRPLRNPGPFALTWNVYQLACTEETQATDQISRKPAIQFRHGHTQHSSKNQEKGMKHDN
jgi:hypothetical protein